MNLYTSDMHLFHPNVTGEGINFDGRPFATLEEMHSSIRNNWNAKVTNADHVYILGDMTWKVNDDSIAFVSTLKGNKHLILGNHDSVKDLRYSNLFADIVDYKKIRDKAFGINFNVIASHFPMMFWDGQRRFNNYDDKRVPKSVHLYGHVHNSIEERIFQKFITELNTEYDYDCVAANVGSMIHNYTPMTLEELLGNEFKKRYNL